MPSTDYDSHRASAKTYLRMAESTPNKTGDACASIATAHALLALLDALGTRPIPPESSDR